MEEVARDADEVVEAVDRKQGDRPAQGTSGAFATIGSTTSARPAAAMLARKDGKLGGPARSPWSSEPTIPSCRSIANTLAWGRRALAVIPRTTEPRPK